MDDDAMKLIMDAQSDSSLRTRLSQDRSATELAETASRKGYSLSAKQARRILAGAYLTSNNVSEDKRRDIMGGLAWDFLKRVEDELNRDFGLLRKPGAWERAEEFYRTVYLE